MPASGKSTVGKIIAEMLNKNFIDVDDFIYEQTKKDSAEHLVELGDKKFLNFETKIVKKIKANNSIIASSGSTPLKKTGMNYLRKNSLVVWMNIPLDIIEKRIHKRSDKNTRVVGAQTMSFEEILNLRLNKYKNNHDICYISKSEKPPEQVAQEIINLTLNEIL